MNTTPEIANDPSELPHKEQMKLRRQFQDEGQRQLDWHKITDYKNAKRGTPTPAYVAPVKTPRALPEFFPEPESLPEPKTAADIIVRLNASLV
jgi:hypothetical protein